MIRAFAGELRSSSLATKAFRLKTAFLWRGIRRHGQDFVAPCPPQRERWDSTPLSNWDSLPGFGLHFMTYDKLGDVEGDFATQLRELKTCLVILGTYKPKNTPSEIMNDPRLDLTKFPLLSKDDVSKCIKKYISILYNVESADGYYQCIMFLINGDFIKLSADCMVLYKILAEQHVYPNLDQDDMFCAVMEYVRLFDQDKLYNPSSSEISKRQLLLRIKRERERYMIRIYTNGLVRSLFMNYDPMRDCTRLYKGT